MVTIEGVIWFLFLLDSLGANFMALFAKKWWKKKKFHKILPMHSLWTLLYLVLVLWVGSALWRLGLLTW
jgi:hypothetical protein